MSPKNLNIADIPDYEASFSLFPATACQQRFWQQQADSPGASALNTAFRLHLTGTVTAGMIETAFNHLIERYEILRTGFILTGEGLRQQVWAHVRFSLDTVDLRGLDEQAAQARFESCGRQEARKPFALSARSFVRAVWIPRTDSESELLVTFHSLVMDGWSWATFVRELVELLAAAATGRKPELAPVDLQYGDYALWKEEFLQSGALEGGRRYWRGELNGFRRFEVPADYSRPAQRRYEGAIRSVLLPHDLADALAGLAKARGVTTFSLALAALCAALARVSGSEQVAVGTQITARDQKELETVMGPLVNTAVLRLDVPGNRTMAELAAQCSAKIASAIEHAHVPFEEMIAMTKEVPDPLLPPLCPVNFAFQHSFIGVGHEVKRDGICATTPPSFASGAIYDLSFFMVGRAEGWRISCEGDTGLFDIKTVDSLLQQWRQALEVMAFRHEEPVSQSLSLTPRHTSGQRTIPASGSAFMSTGELEAAFRRIVVFNEKATGTPVIALNNTAVFFTLAQQIGSDHPFIDIPLVPEGEPRAFPPRAFEDIAADAVRLIRMVRPHGPYIIMGLCVLGALGFEAARQLRREGETVELVILNDSWCPGYRETMPVWDRFLRRLRVQAKHIPRDFMHLVRGEMPALAYLQQYRIFRKLRIADIGLRLGLLKGGKTDFIRGENRWYMDYLLAQQKRYRPSPYDGAVQIFRSQEALKGRLFADEFGWKPVVSGRLVVTQVPAMHAHMFREQGACVIGRQIRERLAGMR